MDRQTNQSKKLVSLLEQHATEDGVLTTSVENLFIFRYSHPHNRVPQIYPPGIIIGAQGRKNIYLNEKRYKYGAGDYLTLFVPMAVECRLVEASMDKPLLAAGIAIDMERITKIIMKLDRFEQSQVKPSKNEVSGIIAAPISDQLLDATIRLLQTLNDSREAEILGEGIVDEIYFRILMEGHHQHLAHYLQHRGQIQQIAKAVEFVHQNLDQPVNVDALADLVNMSSSGFHKKFKDVMHLSPLQYAKSIKLSRAQSYIMDGKSVSEASFMVGYNNLAQFSREYKRHFGFLPSATRDPNVFIPA